MPRSLWQPQPTEQASGQILREVSKGLLEGTSGNLGFKGRTGVTQMKGILKRGASTVWETAYCVQKSSIPVQLITPN